ncbi:flavin reductase (DIM6/NTAB) family NADH-FMN oxidoreductase RutF [Rhodobacter viridis]|uniref:Flavin reductase (DIM6/NTAB) family NADH-FMN oxidoreductase RutF n=1 Tax=Rhodobacter viridis TaxID=1054202 RepID=A0A318U1V7_9RHOB|nr:flavin reductase family protein [Rhodobacter viridis]PYF11940.1 flavin reductase (DIM6/NTAB) family NADH-FMN oxidoreductase RutF [Rhodobacter viridis]
MSESDRIDAAIRTAEDLAKGHLPDPADPRLLRDALGRFATGVALVTACDVDDGSPIAIVVNSFASVSLDPPLVLWSAARSSMRHRHFTSAPAFAIHILAEGQRDLTSRFSRSGPGFEGLTLARNGEGVPVLPEALARFDCVTEALHEGGDHTIIIGRVTRFDLQREGGPLCFFGGGFGGFAPGS